MLIPSSRYDDETNDDETNDDDDDETKWSNFVYEKNPDTYLWCVHIHFMQCSYVNVKVKMKI